MGKEKCIPQFSHDSELFIKFQPQEHTIVSRWMEWISNVEDGDIHGLLVYAAKQAQGRCKKGEEWVLESRIIF